MDWSQRRKLILGLIATAVVLLVSAYPVYLLLNKAPTCFDAKQDGTETGVDCGGACSLSCLAEIKSPRVIWSKAFPLYGDYYDLAAYLENPNGKAGVKKARYALRAYDASGSVLVEKKGETEIPPGSGFMLFQPNAVIMGALDRVEVVFVPEDLVRWIKSSTVPSVVTTKNQTLKNADTKPRYDVVLVNNDMVNSVSNLTLSAIVYNSTRTPIAVSQTYVNAIPKNGEQNIFFTWPNKFNGASENFITEILVTPHTIFAE